MGRKRKGDPVNGWIIVDKPTGIGSTPVVNQVRRAFNAQKAGHGGTLDPFASGVLPVALGEATKTMAHIVDGLKTYEFTIAWGVETDTLDIDGQVTATSPARPDRAAIEAALPAFIGIIEQIPPAYSAIKVDGRRAYDIARKAVGEGLDSLPELDSRPVVIDRLELRDADAGSATFFVACGKGTYIRSLARDFAVALGTVGHVSRLRRLSVGPFDESDAISLAFLEKLEHSAAAFEHLKPVTSALDDIPALPVSAGEAAKLRHGQTLPALSPAAEARFVEVVSAGTGVAIAGSVPVALVSVKAGQLHPLRVFNL